MEDRKKALWQGARPLIGSVVGVGIFGLPFVFSEAGYVFGLVELVIVASLALLTYFIFADLLVINKEHVRFVAVVGHQLGPVGRVVAAVAFFGSLWGAMLAYVIVGGQFIANVLHPWFGGPLFHYQLAFWLIAASAMIGGSLFVRRLQAVLIPFFVVMIVGLALFAIPHLHVEYLTASDPGRMLLPFGALIFAFSGFAAVPESREVLGRRKQLIRPSLILSVVMVTLLYGLFTLAIVGMTGPFTSHQAVEGLRFVAGPWLSIFVSVIGLCTVFTAFVSVGNSVMNSLLYDFRGRFLSSWWLAVVVPLCVFLFGARDFIQVIGATGGLLGGLSGIVLVLAYERARLTAQLPKRELALPQALVALAFLLFVAMIVATLIEIV
ncbi:MAG TPA: aromatic amino acid transport family protein [bacterium]|nr:aromatic amino acid transport family protein [bacterium]